MNDITKQAQVEELAIELDENGMVIVNDPELLKLVAGGLPGGPGTGPGVGLNGGCGPMKF